MLTRCHPDEERLFPALLLLSLLVALAGCAKNPNAEEYQPRLIKGKEALSAGDSDAAIKELSGAIAAKPEPEAYRLRGEAHAARGDHDEAAKDFYEALDRDQDSPQTWYVLGLSDTARQEYGAAEAAFAKALRLDPDFAPAYYGRAMVNKAQGKTEAAVADLKRFLEKNKDDTLRASAQAILVELEK